MSKPYTYLSHLVHQEAIKVKKHLYPLIGLLMTFNVQAAPGTYTEGKEFIALQKTVHDAPVALEYFSFYCPSCYRYDEIMKIAEHVEKVLPDDVALTQYHASFMGPLGEDLTHAWSVAILLNIEDKIKPLMFDAVQKKQSINTAEDIRAVFINAGVSASDYDSAWNSFAVKSLTAKQKAIAEALELHGVPAMFVNGKYQVNPKGLNNRDVNSFVQHYADTVRFLLAMK